MAELLDLTVVFEAATAPVAVVDGKCTEVVRAEFAVADVAGVDTAVVRSSDVVDVDATTAKATVEVASVTCNVCDASSSPSHT